MICRSASPQSDRSALSDYLQHPNFRGVNTVRLPDRAGKNHVTVIVAVVDRDRQIAGLVSAVVHDESVGCEEHIAVVIRVHIHAVRFGVDTGVVGQHDETGQREVDVVGHMDGHAAARVAIILQDQHPWDTAAKCGEIYGQAAQSLKARAHSIRIRDVTQEQSARIPHSACVGVQQQIRRRRRRPDNRPFEMDTSSVLARSLIRVDRARRWQCDRTGQIDAASVAVTVDPHVAFQRDCPVRGPAGICHQPLDKAPGSRVHLR